VVTRRTPLSSVPARMLSAISVPLIMNALLRVRHDSVVIW
jgi:hypothetical protein